MDPRQMTEEQYREWITERTRERYHKIMDGSYVNESWAPHPGIARMIRKK